MSKKKTLFIALGILLVGAGITYAIFQSEPTAERGGATKKTAMLVETMVVKRDTFQPIIRATGNVQAAQSIDLSARVNGYVSSIDAQYEPGAVVSKGQTLLRLDPADFSNSLQQAQTAYQRAKANLQLEMGRQNAAKQGFSLLGDSVVGENKSLVLREPQLLSAQADLQAAEAQVEQAKLNLNRTRISAPFDALVVSRNANVGSQINAGASLGRLIGTSEFWVVVNVPLATVPWISLAEKENSGAKVRIENNSAWPSESYREGTASRLIGVLDQQSRLARLLVRVHDPLCLQEDNQGMPQLVVGSFVRASIPSKTLNGVVRLSRDFVRKEQTVWVMQDGALEIRKIETAFTDANYVYVKSGLADGDQVVTTNLATVIEGAPLRTQSEKKS